MLRSKLVLLLIDVLPSCLCFSFCFSICLLKRHGVFYTSAIPEVSWYLALYSNDWVGTAKIWELLNKFNSKLDKSQKNPVPWKEESELLKDFKSNEIISLDLDENVSLMSSGKTFRKSVKAWLLNQNTMPYIQLKKGFRSKTIQKSFGRNKIYFILWNVYLITKKSVIFPKQRLCVHILFINISTCW